MSLATGDGAEGAGGVGGLIFELLPELLPGEGLTGWLRAAGRGGQGKRPQIRCRSPGQTERLYLSVSPRPRAGEAQLGISTTGPPLPLPDFSHRLGGLRWARLRALGPGGSLEGPCPVAVACAPGQVVGAPLPAEGLIASPARRSFFE